MGAALNARYRLFLFILLLFASGAALWHLYGSPDALRQAQTWLPKLSQGQGYAPVLGRDEDPARLYYPPRGPRDPRLKIAKYAQPPAVRQRTPVFIGFTNNNAMLKQCVLSYIAAGWPPEDIIIVENTPTMDSNIKGRLPKESYFYLDYDLFRGWGVSIIQTPVYFTFSQLQNFYLRTALAHNWPTFFWSHMDILVVGEEAPGPNQPAFKPFYHRILSVVRTYTERSDWAIKWFSCTLGTKACDMLVLVNVAAWATKIGQWDPFIPYYISDCDAFSRMVLHGFSRESAADHIGAGHIFDVGTLLPGDPIEWLFPEIEAEGPNSDRFQRTFSKMQTMEGEKLSGDEHRNDWQETQSRADPDIEWDYDPKAFRTGWWALSDAGRALYSKKWGTDRCELGDIEGFTLQEMWKDRVKAKDAAI